MAANFAEGTSQTQVGGVTRLKMSAVVHPTGGTYGINLQATRFCGPKAGVACTPAPSSSAAQPPVDHGDQRTAAPGPPLRVLGEAAVDTTAVEVVAVLPGRSTAADPDYPIGRTAISIWIDTNVVVGRSNASAAGFGGFDIAAAAR
jgi:hypothetical protein